MNHIEKRVLEMIGESTVSPDVFSEGSAGMDLLRGSVNDAIQSLCAVTGEHTKICHLTMLENRQFYRIVTKRDHFGYAVEVWDRSRNQKLEQIGLLTLAKMDPFFMKVSGGYPEYYGHAGEDHLWFYPYAASSGVVLEIRFVAIPKAYTADTDPVKIRRNFEDSVVNYAASEYYASRGDAARATEYFAQYLSLAGLGAMNPKQAERQWGYGQKANASWQRG